MFLGRGPALEELLRVVESAAAGGGGGCWLVGDAGVGKTALLDEVVRLARPEARVLRVVGREGETELPWGALEQLVAPLVADGLDEGLAPPRRAAVRAALALDDGERDDHSPLATLVGTRDLLLAASTERPVLVVVDDVHWVDPPSRRALDHLLPRLDETRLAVVVAGRPSDDSPAPIATVTLDALDDATADALLLAAGVDDDRVRAQIVDELGGNPLLLRAAADGLDERQRAGLAPLPEVLPVPATVGEWAEHRLRGLDRPTRETALVAAIAPAGDLRTVTAALVALDHATDRDHALDRAEGSGILEVDGARVRFTHPTLRSAAYHLAPAEDRRRAHRAVADAAGDPIAQAWHAGQATLGPDESAADGLARAAHELLGRRAPGTAAAFLERAASLTADAARSASWLREGAEALAETGRRDAALALLLRAEATEVSPLEAARRERVRLRLTARSGGMDHVVDRLRQLAESVEPLDARLSAEILLDCVPALIRAFRATDLEDVAKAAVALADRAGATDLTRRADVVLGGVRLARGEIEGQQHLDRYVDVLEVEGPVAAARFLAEVVAPLLGILRRGPEVDALFERLDHDLRVAVAVPALVTVLGAWSILTRGRDLHRAIALDREAIELADGIHQPDLALFAAASLAMTASVCGDVELTTWAADRCARSADPTHRLAGEAGRAHLHLARGELDPALALYEDLYERHGVGRSLVRWEPDWCEALVRSRDLERATAMIDEFAGSPVGLLATGGIARVRGMLAADDAVAVEQFEHAFRFLDIIPNDIVRGRTELVWGERLRRSRRRGEARGHLARAEALLRGVGAEVWADRAAAELVTAGASPADRQGEVDALTGKEREIVALALGGATNREIADAVYLSPRTVETHLGAAYRKLGVTNRRGLVRWAAEHPGTLDD